MCSLTTVAARAGLGWVGFVLFPGLVLGISVATGSYDRMCSLRIECVLLG